MPRGFGSRHVSSVSSPAFRSMALLNKRENVNRTRSRCSNSVHPSVPTSRSLKARALTAGCERTQEVSDPAAPSYQNYVVKVRVLHGIDLYIPHMKAACQHVACPTVNITLNKNPMQSSTAAQHARNHSIWKKHELTFRVNDVHQAPPQSGMAKDVAPSPFISMFVSLSFIPCTCSSKTCEKMPPSILIGEVGELQLPVNESEKYEISRFFPVIRRQHQNAQSVFVLLPAGKIKLSIYVELEKPVSVVVQPKRPPFALPTNFGEALQLKRKQLKVTVVPEDITSQKAPQIDLIAPGLLQEIAVETAQDHLDAGDLEIKSRIGEGIHSCVSLGNLSQRNNNLTQQVAVKEFRHQHALPPVNVLRAFQQEYRLLERCRRQNGHQHIVDLLGVILEPRLIIVMEYFSRGR
ncbi:unnamed protein product [Phytophthora lilii]|uniref:Unnamed protein product n=1 Tax=Phytophthora lilii TaxID=2077276 RepID=A0A9W7CW14_9STRA|nr:unnamed protein product [Phytophthora lilii]